MDRGRGALHQVAHQVEVELQLFERLYGKHPYAHPSEGTEQSIPGISVAQLQAFHQKAYAAGNVVGSVRTGDATGVWLIGMRYKIMDANTTEQVAQGYKDLKMEVGATGTSVLGVSSSAKGGVGLDTMVQRLVQTLVWDIDAKHK